MKKILTVAVLAAFVLVGGALESRADLNFTVDGTQAWVGYMNSAPATGPWGTGDLRASFLDSSTLFLQTNVNASDDNGGASAPAPWVPGTTVMEANMYQEAGTSASQIAAGTTVNFNFTTVADTLTAAGYTAEAFIKVLDPDSSWATIDNNRENLVVGQGDLTWTTTVSGVVQAGFTITGFNDYTGSGIDTLGVTVIPEPATFGLLGLAGAGLFIRRRLMS